MIREPLFKFGVLGFSIAALNPVSITFVKERTDESRSGNYFYRLQTGHITFFNISQRRGISCGGWERE
jgi:hypothetical protein